MLTIQTAQVTSKSTPQTLRQESCVCANRVCSLLFDGRKIVSATGPTQSLPRCWKKGSDVFVSRVDRRAAEADMAMEKAYELIQIGK